MKKTCLYCKTIFEKDYRTSKKHFLTMTKYCGRECKHAHGKELNLYIPPSRKGISPWNKGLVGVNTGELNGSWKGGKPNCLKCDKKLSKRGYTYCQPCRGKELRGEKNPSWKGGAKSERKRLMGQKEYILWRTAVFMRDDYTCQMCEEKGGRLEADHIKSWALYPEFRYAIDNGRTLCHNCHTQTDTYMNRWAERRIV